MTAASLPDRPIRLALVGIGKIARDQHAPAIEKDARFQLCASVSPHSRLESVVHYDSLDAMIADGAPVDAVSLCTPPKGRHALAARALEAGLHVMLEKPPATTVGEALDLVRRAGARGVSLFATWHSREAAAVDEAARWLAGRTIREVRVTWREDIRVWHPGQEWILDVGGLGVFDPAINAFSIVTRLLPHPMVLADAQLDFPENRQAPIAAQLSFLSGGAPVTFDLDFLQSGPQTWNIDIETETGNLSLTHGGSRLGIDGEARGAGEDHEYSRLYARFAELVRLGESEADLRPLQHVADVFLAARRRAVDPFSF